MNISFALGKANEDIGEIQKSFQYYKIANDINRSKINFSLERDADNAIKFLKVHIEKGLEHALALFKEQT